MRVVAPQRSLVIPNGIDLRDFTPDVCRRAEARTAMRAADEFVWIAVGRIVPAKDYRTLLLAWKRLCETGTNLRLWIVGQGTSDDAEAMQRFCIDLGISSAVSWLGVRHDIARLLDAADAFVSSSAWEGMPLAIGEAMAMGKPVVATNVGGVLELTGDCGVLANAGDPKELAIAMQQIMAMDTPKRTAWGTRARRRIEEHFTMERNADAWVRLYASL